MLLNNNSITELVKDGFASSTLTLVSLSLSNNQIKTIHENAFSYLFQLEELNLSNNRISHLKYEMFIDLKNLVYLNLGNNYLNTLTRNVFSRFEKLQTLLIFGNQLKQFNPNIFGETNTIPKSLMNLVLSHNQIVSYLYKKIGINQKRNYYLKFFFFSLEHNTFKCYGKFSNFIFK